MRGEKSNFVEHPGETSCRIRTPGESEKTDLVTLLVGLHEESIRIPNVYAEATANGHIEGGIYAIRQAPAIVGADAGLIVRDLGGIRLLQTADEADDVTVVAVELTDGRISMLLLSIAG